MDHQHFTVGIPRMIDGTSENVQFTIQNNDRIFLLGTNGVGKSSFIQYLVYSLHGREVVRIAAHRQTWFETGSIGITPAQRSDYENTFKNYDYQQESRYIDRSSADRINATLFDLVNEEVRLSQYLAALFRESAGGARADEARSRESPTTRMNRLLRSANLPITIEADGISAIQARRDGGEPFDVAQLSDGQRAALLLAASVLTAKPGTLFLIDEPERHLHRSISAPLLRDLFIERPDCAMVVSTHDIDLAAEHPEARVLILRHFQHVQGQQQQAWTYDELDAGADIPDDLRADVLGARRRIVFVEGERGSLDYPLYQALLPSVTVVPKGSSRDVIASARALRGADGHHWLEAFGLVDRDGRDADEIAALARDHIHVLSVNAVESIYFYPTVLRGIAQRSADLHGTDPESSGAEAENAAVAAIKGAKDRLCAKAVELRVRRKLFDHLPDWKAIQQGWDGAVSIDASAFLAEETQRFETAVAQNDLATLVRHYKVRETPALAEIAKKLQFGDRKRYEAAAQKMLREDASIAASVRGLFEALWEALEASGP